jgi:murein DD-endopeptidase MepM/ murein hydrolase activator NlpD
MDTLVQSVFLHNPMAFKFANQPLAFGLYEPEGIYLHTPFEGRYTLVQFWGEHADYYAQFKYNGLALKGHLGLDFAMPRGTRILTVDAGRVTELSYERGGFGRYLKIEHTWGESLYANLDEIDVESGQIIQRGDLLGYSGASEGDGQTEQPHLHFGIRIKPYNRFDGWGGFTDPLPYLSPTDFVFAEEIDPEETPIFTPPPMAIEKSGMRRP